ncbi:MAG: hypothetical protein VKK04_08440, partial [Synechococcales bacterium]|nr:hypothetical protein [Synechococcales bacterium]
LQAFVQTLKLHTSDLLEQHTSERSQRATQLFQDLNQFHGNLVTLVEALRLSFRGQLQLLQADVKTLQNETQIYLGDCQQQRQQLRQQLLNDLMQYAQDLRDQVDMRLAELEEMRQQRAQQLQQTFADQRIERSAEMLAFFHNLAEFRAELHQYCVDLYHMVWGEGSTPMAAAPSAANGAKNGHATPDCSTPPPEATPVPAPATASQPATESTSADPEINQIPASEFSPTTTATVIAPKKDQTLVEQEIYDHIKTSAGARLGELETTLGLNRFQAVDALRSLIKQGKVTQRDRVYVIHEEFSS